MASRYSSYNETNTRSSTTSSSQFSDPSSSFELSNKPKSKSRAIVKSTKPITTDLSSQTKTKSQHQNTNLTTLMKKFMERKSSSSSSRKHGGHFVIPSEVIAEDLKKMTMAKKGTNFTSGLQKKLFGKQIEKEVKALTEVKGNTRTLAMVLRSERELLTANKDLELEIQRINSLLDDKNNEVEKLKDLCLKQREEIKSLKSAVLFPESANLQLQELVEKQGSELKQAKQVIPTLQRQVTSLTGQLQFLAEDLAEVRAEKYSNSASAYLQRHSTSPRMPYNQKVSNNSLEFSSSDFTMPGSPDDVFLEDLNPCLTPYCVKEKSKEFEEIGYDSPTPCNENLMENKSGMYDELKFSSFSSKLSKSSDCCENNNIGSRMVRQARRSDGSKGTRGKQMHHRLF
ncbi:uncharacterized protein [Rutidosis leptorrhynchoides]|uniref:uncharacterized protein n=1 Tax=Rutidosis leptorrhynchoides TaxID=125765 RepID=UPI003A99D59C